MKMFLAALAVGMVLAQSIEGRTLRVPSQYSTIQAGINAAVNGDTVLVADGTYTGEGNKNLDFGGRAIVVMSENGPDSCVIDCERAGRGFYFHSNETRNSVVQGFTIIHGYVSSTPLPSYFGGGIYCGNSSPTIARCYILECHAAGG